MMWHAASGAQVLQTSYERHPCVGETKDYSWYNLGHMTKMTVTPIHGENPSKIFSSTKWSLTLQLGM